MDNVNQRATSFIQITSVAFPFDNSRLCHLEALLSQNVSQLRPALALFPSEHVLRKTFYNADPPARSIAP